MIDLKKVLSERNSENFSRTLKSELQNMGVEQLPLQQGLSSSSIALDKDLEVVVLDTIDKDEFIQVKAGIFYTGIISGCNCADDPTPPAEQNEYCEVELKISTSTGQTTVKLLAS